MREKNRQIGHGDLPQEGERSWERQLRAHARGNLAERACHRQWDVRKAANARRRCTPCRGQTGRPVARSPGRFVASSLRRPAVRSPGRAGRGRSGCVRKYIPWVFDWTLGIYFRTGPQPDPWYAFLHRPATGPLVHSSAQARSRTLGIYFRTGPQPDPCYIVPHRPAAGGLVCISPQARSRTLGIYFPTGAAAPFPGRCAVKQTGAGAPPTLWALPDATRP